MTEKEELAKYREKARKHAAYSNQYQRDHYARLICLLPADKKAAFDAARAGVAVSVYLNQLIDADLRRRGLLDDGASAPAGASGAARPVDDNRAEDSGGGDGAEVQPMERADASRMEDGGAGASVEPDPWSAAPWDDDELPFK